MNSREAGSCQKVMRQIWQLKGKHSGATELNNADIVLYAAITNPLEYPAYLEVFSSLLISHNQRLEFEYLSPIRSVTHINNGALYQHLFWHFISEKYPHPIIQALSDDVLRQMLKDMPIDITEEQLAVLLPYHLLNGAYELEDKFIKGYQEYFSTDHHRDLYMARRCRFVLRSKELTNKTLDILWKHYYSNSVVQVPEDTRQHTVKSTIQEAADKIIKGNNTRAIYDAGARIRKFKPEWLKLDMMKVARHSTINFLMSECAMVLDIMDNKHIIHTERISTQLKVMAILTGKIPIWHTLTHREEECEDLTYSYVPEDEEPTKSRGLFSSHSEPNVHSLFFKGNGHNGYQRNAFNEQDLDKWKQNMYQLAQQLRKEYPDHPEYITMFREVTKPFEKELSHILKRKY